jgi:hypothetical protein
VHWVAIADCDKSDEVQGGIKNLLLSVAQGAVVGSLLGPPLVMGLALSAVVS